MARREAARSRGSRRPRAPSASAVVAGDPGDGADDLVALAGLVVAGLGSAAVYPAVIHSTPVTFGRRNSQAIIGIQMAAAYPGPTLVPPLFGVLSTWLGMGIFPFFLAVFVVLGLAMSEPLNRLSNLRAAG